MYIQNRTKSFKKDVELSKRRGLDMSLLKEIMHKLIHKIPLEARHKNHALKGRYFGFRDCHIQNDWLLIYRIERNMITFVRTGTHSDLFR